MIDLAGLTPEILTELTNVGTVRRATKELDRVALTFTESDRGLVVVGDDDSRCLITPGAFADWECDCPAGSGCRHLVRAVLAWQRAGGGSATDESPTVVDERTSKAAAVRRARLGLVALVSRGARTVVGLHLPEAAVVRFGAEPDPRFARCSCGQPGCAHLADALAALVEADDSGVVEIGGPAHPVPGQLRQEWDRWWALLCELGLGASVDLIGGAGRLAGRLEAAGLVAPAAVLREIADQLGHQVAHDVQLDPDRLVELVGEAEARLRHLELADPRPGLPSLFVAGQSAGEQRRSKVRVVGLGAEYLYVGGWARLRSFVADVRTGLVFTVSVEGLAQSAAEPLSRRLARRGHGTAALADWAQGSGLLVSVRTRGHELSLIRGARASLTRSSRLDIPDSSPVRADTFAEIDTFIDVPAALGPRAHTDGMRAARIAEVGEVLVAEDGAVRARLVDAEGGTAVALLPPAPPELWPARRGFGTALTSGEVMDLAGRWVRRSTGLTVRPTVLWSPDGATLSDLSDAAAPAAGRVDEPTIDDPWRQLVARVTDTLGRLLVAGAARGSAFAAEFEQLAEAAESSGLGRWGAVLRGAAAGVDSPAERGVALADLAVLVALAG